MDNIQKQIEKSRDCAQRVRLSKFPDYHAAMWLERNADTMEKLLTVYELALKVPLAHTIKECSCDDCTAVRAIHKAIAAVKDS